MIGLNDTIPTYVETSERSAVPIQNIVPGDHVYEYGTNKVIEVKCVTKLPVNTIWEVEYTDGRLSYISSSDMIFTGKYICQMISLVDMCLIRHKGDLHTCYLENIKQLPIEFTKEKIVNSLNPDPYIAGALLTHGDLDDEYVNLPSDKESADNHFAHRYNLDFSEMKVGKHKYYYQYNGSPKSEAIKWSEFFKGHYIYPVTKRRQDPIIPLCYTRASINNRWKFIMGAFDIGYDKHTFPDTVSIAATDEYRLILIQRILSSLGVLSRVSYDPTINDKIGRTYRLDVLGSYDTFPGFFYDINHIERILQNHNRKFNFEPEFQLRIKSIRKYTEGCMYNIECYEPNLVYIDSNFLPRVSI